MVDKLESRGRVVLLVLMDMLVVMDLLAHNVVVVAEVLLVLVLSVVEVAPMVMVDLHLRVRSVEHQF